MQPRDLTNRQRERLAEQIGRHLGYYTRLTKRLDKIGMEPTSDLYRTAQAALNGVHSLRVTTLYLSMDEGKTG